MARWFIPVGLALATSAGLHAACSASSENTFTGGAGGGSSTSTSSSSGDLGLDGGFDLDACTGTHCSSDLHSLVDCSGNVVTACPGDQGCSGTACVPACTSAGDNKSTFGCDYYVVGPDILLDAAGACFAAFVVNTWSTPVGLTVDFEGQPLDVTKFAYIPSGSGAGITYQPLTTGQIPPGQVAILFLNRFGFNPLGLVTDCPAGITPAITTKDTAPHGTTLGAAFHVATTAPVVAYDIYPYGGGQSAFTSATLLLPTSAWDTNYIAVDAFGAGFLGGPFVSIVAQEDGTQVTVNPTADILQSPTVAGATKGTPATYALAKGQVLQFTQSTPLAGSVIQSTHPVGVWGGKTNLGIDACCDESAHQQIPPVRALGSEYAAVRYRNRYDGIEEAPPWRLIGAVDGTQLTYDPAPPAGAPTTLALGQVTDFHATGQFVVRSQDGQHPFYMSAHMTGAGLYDPDQQMPPHRAGRRPRRRRVRQRRPARRVPRQVRLLHRPHLPGDQPRARAREGPAGLRRRQPRLRRRAGGVAAPGGRRPVPVHPLRSGAPQLRAAGQLQQRPPRDQQQAALRADRVGVGLGRDGQPRGRLLHPVRELRVPGRRRRGAHQQRGSPGGAQVRAAAILGLAGLLAASAGCAAATTPGQGGAGGLGSSSSASTGGGGASGACDPACASGCCAGGACMDGTTDSACGTSGACTDCAAMGQACLAGACGVSTCNATSCASGCCQNGLCNPGTADAQCGNGGATCADCAAQGHACLTKACSQQAPCSPQSCPGGCCQNGTCQLGLSDQACGVGGVACVDCSAQSQACVNGHCF
jgi:hypothetical protein